MSARDQRPEAGDPSERGMLGQFLHGRDVQCPLCQYNLRGLEGDRCPECGRVLELWIRIPERVQAPWLISFGAAALAAPFGLMYGFGAAMGNLGELRDWDTLQLAFVVLSCVMLCALVVLVVFRRRMLRAAPAHKFAIAAACMVGTMGSWVMLVALILLES